MRYRTYRFLLSLLLVPIAALVVGFAVDRAVTDWGSSGDRATGSLVCGQALATPVGDRVFVVDSIRVAVAMDEERRAAHGGGSVAAARAQLVDAASLFRGVHIHLLAVRTVDWASPDDVGSVSGLLEGAETAVPLDGADIAILLTAQSVETDRDGDARIGDRYAVVARHPGRPDRDAMVLAHELSHLFGAHHGCDLPGHEGLMASQGFSEPDLLCPCTRRVLEMNADRFHRSLP